MSERCQAWQRGRLVFHMQTHRPARSTPTSSHGRHQHNRLHFKKQTTTLTQLHLHHPDGNKQRDPPPPPPPWIWCCISSTSTSRVSLGSTHPAETPQRDNSPRSLNEQCLLGCSTHPPPPPKTPTTNISNFRKDPHHSTSSLWSTPSSCRWLLLLPLQLQTPRPLPFFNDWLFEPKPNETVRVPQPEQSDRTPPPPPPEPEACSPICSRWFARLQSIWSWKAYVNPW